MTNCDPWPYITWVSRSSKVTWGHWPRLTSQWPIANRHMFSGVSWSAESEFAVQCSKNVPRPLRLHPRGQSSSFNQFEFWPLRRSQPARVMPFYLGAIPLRMLHVVTGYSNNALSCSELNREHVSEGFRSLRHILTRLWACKPKNFIFSRKFELWPDLTRSHVDLGLKTICAIARSRRDASTGIFHEAIRPSGADFQGGGRTTPPLHRGRNPTAPHFSFGNAAGSCVDALIFSRP